MATEKATGRDSDKIMLRVPDGMRDRIKAAADANNRTMNAEIVARLYDSFETRDAERAKDTVEAMMNALSRVTTHAESLARRLERMERSK